MYSEAVMSHPGMGHCSDAALVSGISLLFCGYEAGSSFPNYAGQI